jgi:hypothetical protein
LIFFKSIKRRIGISKIKIISIMRIVTFLAFLIIAINAINAIPTPQTECINGDFQCVENVLQQCNLGTWIILQDCGATGLFCVVGPTDIECVFTAPPCIDGNFQCAGNILQECSFRNWVTLQNCSISGLSCVANSTDIECVTPGAFAPPNLLL